MNMQPFQRPGALVHVRSASVRHATITRLIGAYPPKYNRAQLKYSWCMFMRNKGCSGEVILYSVSF